MEQARQAAPNSGIFDKQKPAAQPEAKKPASMPTEKERFPDPFVLQAENKQKTEALMRKTQREMNSDMGAAESAQQALQNQGPMLDDSDDGISEEDLLLAEHMIFKGYAEKDIEMAAFKGKKFTICSTNAEEMSVIDDIAFDMVKNIKSNDDGTVEFPENHIRTMRNALFVALSYRGCNKQELSPDPISHLNTLKKAIIRMNDCFNVGNIKDGTELKESIKKALIQRATLVKRMPTTLIDFLSGEKYRFDSKMVEIMNMKNILLKS